MGKLAYGRMATEKIQGTRNEFHVVKQEEFPIYDGEHDAIISEEDFMLAKEKRERTGLANILLEDLIRSIMTMYTSQSRPVLITWILKCTGRLLPHLEISHSQCQTLQI
jgi:hypothetical protein